MIGLHVHRMAPRTRLRYSRSVSGHSSLAIPPRSSHASSTIYCQLRILLGVFLSGKFTAITREAVSISYVIRETCGEVVFGLENRNMIVSY